MSIRTSTAVNLQFTDAKQIDILLSALSPEAMAPATRRSCVTLNRDGVCLRLTVEAEDTVALRATLNTYLRWINSALNVIEAIKKA
jgi:KEOPS complex subunit Pcc1